MAEQSAFVAQKCTFEYARARAGLNWDKLFREMAFRQAVEKSRWEAFCYVLSDIGIILEGALRPHAAERELELAERMGRLFELCLLEHAIPDHRPEGWGDEIEDFKLRLAQAQLAAPRAPYDIGLTSGGRIYKVLPIHSNLTRFDRELVTNNIRFALCRFHEDMQRRLVPAAVVADLLTSAPAARPAAPSGES
ncbi:hypothetical protein [Oceanibaculum sp.]|uniref:hypothetical protein n=1 Tax=Oceanibaculum sp. TaxID=1903597 RepID=UPI0025832227|nr:hypothetical protein [Oceanibaculum sp.]MCH2394947.1 hypothetical protein [Oceanibaculum sp.]